MAGRYAVGLDYGTESARVVVADCGGGGEVFSATKPYRHGVIDAELPGGGALPPDFALQHPGDYVECALWLLGQALQRVRAEEIVGVGVDFTSCTILPVKRDGTPLMELPEFAAEPHGWVKLWKHHAAQPQAERLVETARRRGEGFLKYYSGSISSEWLLPKCWEILEKAPRVFAAADLFVEAGDWLVFKLTGEHTRNACAAGYKGIWSAEAGFPMAEFLRALDPGLEPLAGKWCARVVAPGRPAGRVSAAFAAASGLKAGTPVSAATIDAHSGVAGMGVRSEGPMAVIMGTSSCHLALSRELKLFDGYAGVVKDGILPGFYGYESGQAATGDMFGWFARRFLGGGDDAFARLTAGAEALAPGASGALGLDWVNGNRSVLMDANLSGALVGLSLDTTAAEAYRALVEASAFGTRMIVDAHIAGGVPVTKLVVCGGLTKERFIMQTYADVTGLEVEAARSGQAVALGAAIFGAVAAGGAGGGFDDVAEAVARMTRPAETVYRPDRAHAVVYGRLYGLYRRLHDLLGREHSGLMRELREIRAAARQG